MFLLIDNYDSFTFNLVQAFMQLGRNPLVVKNDDPRLPELALDPGLSMVCISPGPGRPEQAGLCLEFLARLPKAIPALGVCLGHQILGHFAGARVGVAERTMHGKSSMTAHNGTGIFHGLPSPMQVGRYHSLLVHAEDAPELLAVTANTTDQGETMALRFTDRPWAGVQFHPESVLTPEGARLLANFPAGLLTQNAETENLGDSSMAIAGVNGKDKENALPASSMCGGSIRQAQAGYGEIISPPAPVQMSVVMEELAQGKNLSIEAAAGAFSRLMDGELPASLAGAFLLGLRAKGETAEEVGEAVNAVLARAVPVPPVSGACIDIVGTGGDSKFSFNCSTATALSLAGMGYKVLKHGNRSVSSRCGSADVLERLGIALDTPPESVARNLEKDRFVFLFAPRYHPSFKHVMPIRRELGVRTLFNLLGPLVNPAKPTHHFLGVPGKEHLPLLAETLARTSSGSGAVVCGAGGYDELTPMGEAALYFVKQGKTYPGRLDPAEYGFASCTEEDLAVNGPEDAADIVRALLQGNGPKPMADMLALNLGFALYLLETPERETESATHIDEDCGFDKSRMAQAMARAKKAVAQGAGRRFCNA